jgi:ferric-dicitrate binding protein FerR (iron transport regulator)
MQEDKNHIDYFQLMSKYLSGNAGDAEVRRLEEWVLSSPENEAQFNAFRRAWVLSGVEEENPEIDIEREWLDLSGQLFPEEGKIVSMPDKPRRRAGWWIGVAATAAVVVLAGLWLWRGTAEAPYLEVATQHQVEESRLPDGTRVSLNQYSSLRYIGDGTQSRRQVELTGDAFFEVERDTARPFVIGAGEVQIEVLGTSFYVDARAGRPQVEVIVRSGSVAVTAAGESIALSPDERAVYDRSTGDLRKEANENENYLAWKTSVLTFDSAPLERVVFDLNRTFHANISIASPEIAACEVTATYDRQPLEAIIRILEQTLGIETETRGSELVFSGSRCE